MGWQPDVPDPRDYTVTSPSVRPLLERMGFRKGKGKARLPKRVDLRDENLLPPPQDQGPLGSSCAFAVLDLVEHLERKHLGRSLEASKLFLHQLTVRFASSSLAPSPTRSVGTTLRTTFKALTRFGAPPACFWPYDPDHFDREPAHPLLFSFTREYASLHYFRLDTSTGATGQVRASPQKTLRNVKRLLALGIPCVCGVATPRSLTTAPHFPLPDARDELRGGQAVLILGYEDADPDTTGTKSRQKSSARAPEHRRQQSGGAFLVRSSWGTRWGEEGYGWLREGCLVQAYASDFWTAVRREWAGEP